VSADVSPWLATDWYCHSRVSQVPGSLADVVPSLLAGLGVASFADHFGLNPARGVCLLLVDGLGWRALRKHSGTPHSYVIG
jgi:hypothetical protein